MLDLLTDAASDAMMEEPDWNLTDGQLRWLRNRIWISWFIWVLTFAGIVSEMINGFWYEPFSPTIAAIFVFQFTRLLRAYHRPKLEKWHLRRHLYSFTYLFTPLGTATILIYWGSPLPVAGWIAFGFVLLLLWMVQVREDLQILSVIADARRFLRNEIA